jgi:hydroxyacylglutathione hydrolase
MHGTFHPNPAGRLPSDRDETTQRAVVVDPRRDIAVYLEDAEQKGLNIERVLETHLHADFLSGHLELAAATGAVISFGEEARLDFPSEPVAHARHTGSTAEVTRRAGPIGD